MKQSSIFSSFYMQIPIQAKIKQNTYPTKNKKKPSGAPLYSLVLVIQYNKSY